ncbi:MAG: PqqD family protein [Sphingomonadales bacterium]|nr:PqqD family protein [Sphingomonadales bacterium]MBD3772414.1 PqqD family protein [Paracoccaceae bacterium]
MIWQRADEWVGSTIDDSFVMVHIETGKYVALNATASAVWEALESPSDEDAIVTTLTQSFDIDTDTCRASVDKLLDQMKEMKLVQPL